jgi:hypothetical protein
MKSNDNVYGENNVKIADNFKKDAFIMKTNYKQSARKINIYYKLYKLDE